MIKYYKNSFGELYEDRAVLNINNREQTINLKNLVKIQFVKRRKYHINYLSFLLSVYLFFFSKNNTGSRMFNSILYLTIVFLLATSYFFKKHQYRVVVIGKNYFIDSEINNKMSKDAENLVSQINRNIQ